jgi:hypothetical protein
MISILFIVLIIIALAFLFTLFWGRQAKEEPKDTIIWKKKLDDHEKAISE